MDVNSGLVAFTMLIIGGSVLGAGTIYGVRAGVDYMGSRGNPRNRAQAHESLVDLIKGVVIIGAVVLGAVATALTTLNVHG